MLKYKLTNGEEEDKNTLNLDKYFVGELYTVKQEVGYFKKSDMRIALGDYIPWDKIEEEPGKGKKIIFSHYYGDRIPTSGYEFLTNEGFSILFMRPNKILFNKVVSDLDEIDVFIYVNGKLRNPTTEEMWNYILEHENIEEYKEELKEINRMSNIYHEDKKDLERIEASKDKVLIKKIK